MNRTLTVKFRILLLALALMTLQGSSLFGTAFEWDVNSDGDWEIGNNWDFNGGNPIPPYPDSDKDIANLGTGVSNSIISDLTVTITSSNGVTVKTLTFDNGVADYTLAGEATPGLILATAGNAKANVNVDAGSHTISTDILLSTDTKFNISGSNTLIVSGNIDGSGANTLEKTGTGTLLLTGQNTYKGGTIVLAGTIELKRPGGGINALNDGTGHDITINSGGTLLLGSNNQINDNTKMTLSGGTFNTGGYDETLNNLTLSATSTIDFDGSGGAGDNSVLVFADASGNWSGNLLNITNWTGSSEGDDQLFFGSILDDKLSQIRFIDPAGFAPGTYGARLIGNEVVPIPEPSAMIGAGLLSGLIFLDILRRRKQRREEETEAA